MKRDGIQNCALCGKGLMHESHLNFYRVKVEMLIFDLKAIQRAHGMELLMGSAVLANIMGPNDDLAKVIGKAKEVLICGGCSTKRHAVAELGERCAVEDDDLAERARVEEQEVDRHEADRARAKEE